MPVVSMSVEALESHDQDWRPDLNWSVRLWWYLEKINDHITWQIFFLLLLEPNMTDIKPDSSFFSFKYERLGPNWSSNRWDIGALLKDSLENFQSTNHDIVRWRMDQRKESYQEISFAQHNHWSELWLYSLILVNFYIEENINAKIFNTILTYFDRLTQVRFSSISSRKRRTKQLLS